MHAMATRTDCVKSALISVDSARTGISERSLSCRPAPRSTEIHALSIPGDADEPYFARERQKTFISVARKSRPLAARRATAVGGGLGRFNFQGVAGAGRQQRPLAVRLWFVYLESAGAVRGAAGGVRGRLSPSLLSMVADQSRHARSSRLGIRARPRRLLRRGGLPNRCGQGPCRAARAVGAGNVARFLSSHLGQFPRRWDGNARLGFRGQPRILRLHGPPAGERDARSFADGVRSLWHLRRLSAAYGG